MYEFWSKNWQPKLASANLNTFSALWDLKADWFEEPNIRRGGWSGVVKYQFNAQDEQINVFIKRQENHVSKTLLHPFKGIATFQKEFHNINRLSANNIPTLELVYFGKKGNQAILITKSLEGYDSLDSTRFNTLEYRDKRKLLKKIAKATALMHLHSFQHNCFYPKHIFVQKKQNDWDIRFIDLEKLKRPLYKKQAVLRDLLTLYRHANDFWTTKDRIYFFKTYVNENKLSKNSKKLWLTIAKKAQAKHK